MKKYIFSLFAIIGLSLIVLFGCNAPDTKSATFLSDEYVLSIGDNFDINNQLKLKGYSYDDITISSTNQQVLEIQNGKANALSSGTSVIFASIGGENIATTSVFVKYQYSKVSNIQIDNNGYITWQRPSIVYDSNIIYPSSYIVHVKNITNVVPSEQAELPFSSFESEYGLNLHEEGFSFGQYQVVIEVVGDDIADGVAFDEDNSVVLNYGVMGTINNITFTPSLDENKSATLSWTRQENAEYDIYLNGFMIGTNVATNYFTYSYLGLDEGNQYQMQIVAKDTTGILLETTTFFDVIVLDRINASYVPANDKNPDGLVSWQSEENAFGYYALVTNADLQTIVLEYDIDEFGGQTLEGGGNGDVNIQIIAKGGYSNGTIYINSFAGEELQVCKLNKPSATVTMNGDKAFIEIQNYENNQKFILRYADNQAIFEGNSHEIDLSTLSAGEYTLNLQTLPTTDGKNYLTSDTFIYNFVVLEDFSSFTHTLSGKTSTFSFNEIENANYYTISVNGNILEDVEYTIDNGKVVYVVDLSTILPNENEYLVEFTAGRIVGGREIAVISTYQKTIQVLPIVTQADSQQNGRFDWNSVSNAEYEYQIIKYTDSTRQTIDTEYDSKTTDQTHTTESLTYGYYSIIIYTRSSDTSSYFDSDFYTQEEGEGYFKADFIVTSQIESPEISFSCASGENILTIQGVEFGGGYDVYVDGVKDGTIENNDDNYALDIEYRFANVFSTVKNYTITVNAKSGTKYDSTLHTISDTSRIYIQRLSQPQFTVSEAYNEFSYAKTEELLNVTMIDNASKVDVAFDGQLLNSDGGSTVNMIDYRKFDNEFTLLLTFRAGVNQGDQYYMDSLTRTVNFERVATPTNFSYQNGNLYWTSSDTRVERYDIIIELTTTSTGSSYYRHSFAPPSDTGESGNNFSFDIQSVIDKLISTKENNFSENYMRANSVKFYLVAHANRPSDDQSVYILPSSNAVTVLGANFVEVERLADVTLSFNTESLNLSWTRPAENTTYNIFVNDVRIREGVSSTEMNIGELGLDLLTQKAIYIETKNRNYLDGNDSNTIYITQLSPIEEFTLVSSDNIISFEIKSNLANTKEVKVNGSTSNVNYTAYSAVGTIDPADFSSEEFVFQVIAENNPDQSGYYYINSATSTIKVVNVETQSIVIYINEQDNTINWNNAVPDMTATINNINPITYFLTIKNGENTYSTLSTPSLSYSIEALEDDLNVSFESGNVEVSVSVVIADYSFASTGDMIVYYGTTQSDPITLQKLSSVAVNNSEIIIANQSNIDSYLDGYVVYTFIKNDTWGNDSIINVTVNPDTEQEIKFSLNLANGNINRSEGIYYSFAVSGDNCQLSIYREAFEDQNNIIQFKVSKNGAISSENSIVSLSRMKDIATCSVNPEGVLTILNNEDKSSVFVKISIGTETITANYSLFNVQEESYKNLESLEIYLISDGENVGLLDGKSGNYTIRLVFFDSDSTRLPSKNSLDISGEKFGGLSSVNLLEEGSVLLQVAGTTITSDNLDEYEFVVRYNGIIKTFTPRIYDLFVNSLKIGMLEIIQLFGDSVTKGSLDFEFNVRKNNSIYGEWQSISYSYQTESNYQGFLKNQTLSSDFDYSQDYIFFAREVDTDNTSYFNVKFLNTLDESAGTNYRYIDAISITGYLKKDTLGNIVAFTNAEGINDGFTYQAVYAISLNDLLENFDYGIFEIEISRIGKNGEDLIQYTGIKIELKKLNQINENIREQNNVLSWTWQATGITDEEYQPNGYYIEFNVFSSASADAEIETTIKYFVTANQFDLSQREILEVGKYYRLYIYAISGNSSIITSNPREYVQTIFKNQTPAKVVVQDGKLLFDTEGFTIKGILSTGEVDIVSSLQEMLDTTPIDQFTVANNQIFAGGKTLAIPTSFSYPLNFSTSEVGTTTNISLTFTNSSNQSCSMTVSAVHLFNYIQVEYYADSTAQGDNQKTTASLADVLMVLYNLNPNESANLKSLADFLNGSNYGIGADSILFDDYGSSIPSGEYNLYAVHLGVVQGNIDSDGTDTVKLYLTSAPEILLSHESEGYYVRVRTTTLSDGSEIQRYKMVFRYNYQSTIKLYSSEELLEFDIEYTSTGWQIKLNGTNIEYDIDDDQENDVISTVTIAGDGRSYFKINLTALRDALNFSDLDFDRELILNKDIRVDIYAVAPDYESDTVVPDNNVYVLNGKSAHFNLHFLNLEANSISFKDGQMTVSVVHNTTSPNTILLRYRTTNQGETSEEIEPASSESGNLSDIKTTINLPSDGTYRYIVISLNGAISRDYMKVESKSYAIENLYKMQAPTLTVSNNNLVISLGTNNLNIISGMKFKLGSSTEYFENAVYEYRDIMSNFTSSSFIYQVGIEENELNARSFSAYLLGNSGNLSYSPDTQAQYSHGADYIWTFTSSNQTGGDYSNYVIFSSNAAYINAQMLDVIVSSSVENGSFVWTTENELPPLQDAEGNSAQLIYQVDIDNYIKTERWNGNQATIEFSYDSTNTYYTTAKSLSYIYFSNNFDHYIINVTALSGYLVDPSTTTSSYVQTVEGEAYNIRQPSYYTSLDNAQVAVLRNRTITLGNFSGTNEGITRSQTPSLPSNSYSISNGAITFILPNIQYGGVGGYTQAELENALAIHAVYGETNLKLTGVYTFQSSSNGIVVNFKPDENQILTTSLSIEIYFTEMNKLMSKPLTISNVIKLPDITSSYYTTGLETSGINSGRTYIDFAEYFENFRYSGSNTNYQIVITETVGETSTQYHLTASSTRYYLTENSTIQIQVCDAQGDGAIINRVLFLYSNTLTFEILETVISDETTTLLNISWDDTYKRFVWQWAESDEQEYDYYYYLRFNTGGIEDGITLNNYYMPSQSGRVTSFYIQARNRASENTLYTFSSQIVFSGNVNPSLYSGGNGTESNPYLIADSTDFYNIFIRNSENERYYFALNSNIEVNIADMIAHVEENGGQREDIQTFYGHLIGRNNTLTISATGLMDMQSSYSKVINGLGNDSIAFDKYVALFHTLDSQASIEDLNINFNINLSMQNATNAILSSLVLYNYGTISGVTLSSVNIAGLSTTAQSASNIMVGGIAGINLGDIVEARDNASFTYNTSRYIRFGYGGIAAFNDVIEGDAGRIIYSFSQGNKTVNIQSANAIALLSGIAINNYSLISSSGNSGNFTVTNSGSVSSFTVYVSGITILNSNGTLNYLYNTGTFTRAQVGTVYTSAISYSVVGGTVNTLVDTTSSPLVVSCTITPTIQGLLYANQSAGTNPNLPTAALPTQSTTISTDQGYVLRIVPTSSTVRVTISRS